MELIHRAEVKVATERAEAEYQWSCDGIYLTERTR